MSDRQDRALRNELILNICFGCIVVVITLGVLKLAFDVHNAQDQVTAQHVQVNTQLDQIRAQIASTKVVVDDLDDQMDDVEQGITGVQTDLDAIQAETGVIEGKVDAVQADTDAIETKVDGITVNTGTIISKVNGVSASVFNLTGATSANLAALESTVDFANTNLGTVITNQDEAFAAHADINDNIAGLSDALAGLSTAVGTAQTTQTDDHIQISSAISALTFGLEVVPSSIASAVSDADLVDISVLQDTIDSLQDIEAKVDQIVTETGTVVFQDIVMSVTGTFPSRVFSFDAVVHSPNDLRISIAMSSDGNPNLPPGRTFVQTSDSTAHFEWDEGLNQSTLQDVFELQLVARAETSISNMSHPDFNIDDRWPKQVTLDRQLSLQEHPEMAPIVVNPAVGTYPTRTYSFDAPTMVQNPGNAVLSFALERVDTGQGTVLPLGMAAAFNTMTGELLDWPEVVGVTEYTLRVTVTGFAGLTDHQDVVLTRQVDPPVVSQLNVSRTPQGVFPATFGFSPQSTDPTGGGLVWTLSRVDTGEGDEVPASMLAAFNPATGALSWEEEDGPLMIRTFTLTVTATNDNFLSDTSNTVQITRDDLYAPEVVPISGPITVVAQTSPVEFTAEANDDADQHTVTFSLSSSAPALAQINATTGEFTWLPSNADQGDNVFSVVVSDGFRTSLIPVTISVYLPFAVSPIADFEGYPLTMDSISSQAVIDGAPPFKVYTTVQPESGTNGGINGYMRSLPVSIDPTTLIVSSTGTFATTNPNLGSFDVTVHAEQLSTGLTSSTTFTVTKLLTALNYSDTGAFLQLPTYYWPADDNRFSTQVIWLGHNIAVMEMNATVDGSPAPGVLFVDSWSGLPVSDPGVEAPPSNRICFDTQGSGYPSNTIIDVEMVHLNPSFAVGPVAQPMTFQIIIHSPIELIIPDVTFVNGDLHAPFTVFGIAPFTFSSPDLSPYLRFESTIGSSAGTISTVPGATTFDAGQAITITVTVTDSDPAGPASTTQSFVVYDMSLIDIGPITPDPATVYDYPDIDYNTFFHTEPIIFTGGLPPLTIEPDGWVISPGQPFSGDPVAMTYDPINMWLDKTTVMSAQVQGRVKVTDAAGTVFLTDLFTLTAPN